ncbi:MAG: CHAT domain-containing protein [Bacteroidia bacterium]|nr:CHAT domain-containing protein [Bacteroidia bacterium]
MAEPYTPIIFLAYANDRTDPSRYLRNLVSEVRIIRRMLEQKVSPPYRVIVRGNATVQEIEEVFDRNPGKIEVFHFAGHADGLQLLFESETGEKETAGMEGFTRFLGKQSGLRLVFLNGCATQSHAESLVKEGVSAVIATHTAIRDRAALAFAERFYKRLADRRTIRQAFEDAETRAYTQFSRGDEFRSFYIPGENATALPWKLYGAGTDWLLSVAISTGRGSIIPFLCNRDRQVESFRDSFEKITAKNTHQPPIYFVHGTRSERHRSLVKRFREADIRHHAERLYGKETGLVYFYEVKDWPYTGDADMRRRNLKRSLAISCEFPGITGADWTAQDMIGPTSRKGGIVVFQHTVFAEKWDHATFQLLKWYTGEFWRVSLEKEFTRFVIFINIIYPEERRTFWSRMFGIPSRRQEVRKQLFQLGQTFPEQVSVLRELSPIPYTDVVEWVEEYFPEDLSALPDIIFGEKKERPLSMEIVEYQLIRETERIQREQGLRELYE